MAARGTFAKVLQRFGDISGKRAEPPLEVSSADGELESHLDMGLLEVPKPGVRLFFGLLPFRHPLSCQLCLHASAQLLGLVLR